MHAWICPPFVKGCSEDAAPRRQIIISVLQLRGSCHRNGSSTKMQETSPTSLPAYSTATQKVEHAAWQCLVAEINITAINIKGW